MPALWGDAGGWAVSIEIRRSSRMGETARASTHTCTQAASSTTDQVRAVSVKRTGKKG